MPSEIVQGDTTRPAAGGVAGRGAAVRDAHLRDLADGALRHAAQAALLEEKADPGVQALIVRVCAVARERGVRAEHLILLLKEAWRELPEARRLPRHDAGEMLARAISVSIHAYYARDDKRP